MNQPVAGSGLTEFEYLMQQVSLARASLGEALGLVQDVHGGELDLDSITAALAGAVRFLFEAESNGLTDSSYVGKAMDNLRSILQQMQDVLGDDSNVEEAAGTVARILAILFPVYKALPEVMPSTAVNDSPVPPHGGRHAASLDAEAERRRSQRVELDVDIGLSSDSNFFTGFSMDISEGGLFVATYDMPAIGTHVSMNFKVPGGPVLCVEGVIKWIREYNETTPDITPGVGVMFENLSIESARAIHGYMEHNPPMFFDD